MTIATDKPLKPPFPYFGGKSRAAPLIWQGLGDCINYVEPFAGSLAVLFNRPGYDPLRHVETVNDLDCYLINFWRSLQHDPDAVAYWADYPVTEVDLIARNSWLINQTEFRQRMTDAPDYFDCKIAGWWVWGLSAWIGSGWCKNNSPQFPHLGDVGMGVHRKLPHLGDGGRGSEPCGSDRERWYGRSSSDLYEYFQAIASRLRRVRICNGDWQRILTPSVTTKQGVTGVLLDPPYSFKLRSQVYSIESDVSAQVREWAIAHGDDPQLRIALCGYSDEHAMPDEWRCAIWKARSGYSGQNKAKNDNHHKERIYFSPHCLPLEQIF
jgi:DNA adenine methylase